MNLLSLKMGDKILLSSFVAWSIAQVSKFFIWRWQKGKLNFRILVSAGGMPSSHSALVSAMAMATGLWEGFSSTAFALSLILALVVMYDAAGVRRAAGIQAKILNQILEELFQGHPVSEKRLWELLGHTPFEVLAGALIGVATSAFLYWFR